MERIKIYLILMIVFQSFVIKATPPDWSVNPSSFSYNMTITGAINLNFTESVDGNDIIAAFVGDECRGIANPVFRSNVNRYICYLMVYSNVATETLTFKVYDASADQIVSIEKTIQFEVNGIIGNLEAPYIWSNPTLSNESNILSYSITGETKPARFENYDIYIEVVWGEVFTNLVATYTTSENALVKIGGKDGEIQQSGVTSNDFTNPVIYWVRSADETDTSWYNIHVSWENMSPTWISLSDTTINETYQSGSFIGYLETEDADITDIHSYTLVDGDGDTDNSYFLIDGNKLYLNQDIYFETITSFSIRVKTEDGKGGSFERQIIITVDYLTGQEEVRANKIISPNGDNLFDTWKVQNAGLYFDCDFYILNSIGEIIFQSLGYEVEWDGTYNGQELPIGAYYYVIKMPDEQVLRGTISLIK